MSIHVDAAPAVVWPLVSDITRMPEFSPEIIACRWLDGATGPIVGARFLSTNKVPNRPSWNNRPVVTVVEPEREFTFRRTERFAGTIEWRYLLEPVGGGTLLTESYEVIEPISPVGWFIIGTLFGGKDRRSDLRRGMTETLRLIAATATQRPSVQQS